MRKILFIIMLLCLFISTGCDTVTQENYITNIKVDGYVVSWDEEENAKIYYVNVKNSFNNVVLTTLSTETSYDLSHYINTLKKDCNNFTLTIQVKSGNIDSIYKETVEIIVNQEQQELPKAPTPTNVKLDGTILSWDNVENVTSYQIEIANSGNTSYETVTENFFDFDGYFTNSGVYELKVKAIKSESYSEDSDYSNIIEYIHEVIELNPAPTPTNITLNGSILAWDVIDGINTYEIEISNGTNQSYEQVSTNHFDFSSYFTESGVYTLRVKALKSESYSEDSDYSSSVLYTYEEIQIEKEIFSYDFTKMDSLISGANITKFEKYADKSLKFSSSNFQFTTPTFTALKSFSVVATIKGNNCSGNAVITIYGLDTNNKILEKVEFKYTIENSKHELKAEFTNTNITKIRFEYTTKDKGNVGLYKLVCNHDEESDKVTKIELINSQNEYVINETFNYNGTLLLTYKSGKQIETPLNSIKDQVIISNFNSSKKGEYTATIKYMGVEGKFNYNIIYPYEALYLYADNVNIYTIDINEELNNLFTVLSIKNNQKEINILFDYNKSISSATFIALKDELTNYLESDLLYYYSINNQTLFNQNQLLLLDKNAYNFAPDVDVTISNDYFEIMAYGYSYYFGINDFDVNHKVDILQVNNELNNEQLINLDPEHIILQEGNIDEFINNGILVYQTDNEIFQYAPSLNDTFYYSFTKVGYTMDGDTTELSNQTIWSDSNTLALHHKDVENYVYRKSYYGDIAELYGDELIAALKKVITETHTYQTSYGEAKTMLALTDKDPIKPGNIIMTYTGDSINSTWDQGITWNREHIWPKSLSGGLYTTMSDSSRNAGSDLHHIRPALTAINSSRGNKMYGEQTNESYYYPGDEFIGDVARILFYLSVRYDMDIINLRVCSSLSLLIEWNNTDSVDNLERNRNIAVQDIQGNYNPFIDNPWLADRIFG